MWLINTTTLRLEYFINPEKESYIILSHTWGHDEVLYAEFQDPAFVQDRRGFGKIVRTCEIARQRGISYAWVDTCCIDKSSSAELSEAINSMFEWYKNSAMCIVYLEDLPDDVDFERGFSDCRWLTRGWTLQELIAPQRVHFYDQSWVERTTKSASLGILAQATGVSTVVLNDSRYMAHLPVARRMSWVSKRRTTRVEDLAYCMLGIFDIHIGLIYGEGEKAFIRLQEEIVKQTCDLSIFAWLAPSPKPSSDPHNYRGIFAQSPSEFATCHDLTSTSILPNIKEFTVTNRGLRIEATLITVFNTDPDGVVLNLGVSHKTDNNRSVFSGDGWIGIYLRKSVHGYVRVFAHTLFEAHSRSGRMREPKAILYIPKVLNSVDLEMMHNQYAGAVQFRLRTPGIRLIETQPKDLWDKYNELVLSPRTGVNAYFMLEVTATESHNNINVVVACSTMSSVTCIIYSEQDPIWRHLCLFLNRAQEVSDYTAVDYLLRDFVANSQWGEKIATCGIRDSETGRQVILQAKLSEATVENARGFSIDLSFSTMA